MSKSSFSKLAMIGLGAEKDFLVENLSVLLGSGMDVLASLRAIVQEIKSFRLKKRMDAMVRDIENGEPIWRAMDRSDVFSRQTIALTKIGEETGRLVDNLRVVAAQQQKDRLFRSKVVGAMAYPICILIMAVAVGLWVLFYLLPQLASTFSSLNIPLPFITSTMISMGQFAQQHGAVLLPTLLVSGSVLFFFLFVFPRTKVVGQWMLLSFPGIGAMLRDAETGRIGYLLGSLLSAGVHLVDGLRSVADAAHFLRYKHFYHHLAEVIEEGSTFEQAFARKKGASRRALPMQMQQLVVSSERSGNIPEAFMSIGEFYQYKSDIAAKNITVILEPFMLLFVGSGVLLLALAVILPIYSLVGGLE
jgi:type II secretory pathway component PulF